MPYEPVAVTVTAIESAAGPSHELPAVKQSTRLRRPPAYLAVDAGGAPQSPLPQFARKQRAPAADTTIGSVPALSVVSDSRPPASAAAWPLLVTLPLLSPHQSTPALRGTT